MSDVPKSAPSADATLTLEAWDRYKQELEDWDAYWVAYWNEPEFQRLLDEHYRDTFKWHPSFKGKSHRDVMFSLIHDARRAQIAYRLWQSRPRPAGEPPSPEDEAVALRVVALAAPWVGFGGGSWFEVTPDELDAHFERLHQGPPPEDWLEMDPFLLASNRHFFETFRDDKRKLVSFAAFSREVGNWVRYPNETPAARFMRNARPYAFAIAAMALLVGYFLAQPIAQTLGVGAMIFVALSFWHWKL